MSSGIDIQATPLGGLSVVVRKPLADSRGYLERMFCENQWHSLLSRRRVVQINHTLTRRKGTVRGMHYQRAPHAEMKIVSCLRGTVFDVAVDLRLGSPTFLHWHAELLSHDNHKTLVIPEGFAHGFQNLTDDCEMLYLHTAAYAPNAEGGLNPRDPRLAIAWPLPISEMSPRDGGHAPIAEDFVGIAP